MIFHPLELEGLFIGLVVVVVVVIIITLIRD